MAGLVPAIYVLLPASAVRKTWMPAKTGSPPRYAAGCLCAGMTAASHPLRGAQILLEERERAAPGEVGGGFVVARGAGVVVEGVLGAGINMGAVALVAGLERRFERRDALVDVLVHLGIVQQQRRLDVRHLLGGRLGAVIRGGCHDVGAVGGEAVDDAAAEAEPDGADLAGRFAMLGEIGGAGHGRRDHILAFRLGVKLARLVLVGGRAAID